MFKRYFPAIVFTLAIIVIGCGGGGGAAAGSGSTTTGNTTFPPAGTIKNQLTATASPTAPVTVTDKATGASLTIPADAMKAGAKARLTVWSAQRPLVSQTGWNASAQAYDITFDPSNINADVVAAVQLPWRPNADSIATMIVAYGPSSVLPLPSTKNSVPGHPTATITMSVLKLLYSGKIPSPVTVEVTVKEAVPQDSPSPIAKPVLRILQHNTFHPPTAYAAKKRIAVVVHGLFGETSNGPGFYLSSSYKGSYMQPLLSFLSTNQPTDGTTGKSMPFDPDEVWAYEYDSKNSIESSAETLAADINARWPDPSKFEVHIFAHSMGGLVSRWALEKSGPLPSVIQLVTLGTPHLGVPKAALGKLGFATNIAGLVWSKGFRELADDSSVVSTLKTSAGPSGVKYYGIAGDSHESFYPITVKVNGFPFTFYLGDIINAIYLDYFNGPILHDGIVPAYSAKGGPALIVPEVNETHTGLIADVTGYWHPVAETWLYGINRNIKSLALAPTNPSVVVGSTLTLTDIAYDKDGDKLDPSLINAAWKEVPCTWTVDKPSIAMIDAGTGQLKGVSAGTCIVTATTIPDVLTTTNKPVTQTISVTVTGAVGGYTYTYTGGYFNDFSPPDQTVWKPSDRITITLTLPTALTANQITYASSSSPAQPYPKPIAWKASDGVHTWSSNTSTDYAIFYLMSDNGGVSSPEIDISSQLTNFQISTGYVVNLDYADEALTVLHASAPVGLWTKGKLAQSLHVRS